MKKYPFIKQALVLLLTGVYFFAANGFTLQKLFCGEKLTQISFSFGKDVKCNHCPADKNCKDNCCDSKIVFQKLNDSQNTSASVKVNPPKQIALFNFIPWDLLSKSENNSQRNYSAFVSSPLIPGEPVFLVNRSILI